MTVVMDGLWSFPPKIQLLTTILIGMLFVLVVRALDVEQNGGKMNKKSFYFDLGYTYYDTHELQIWVPKKIEKEMDLILGERVKITIEKTTDNTDKEKKK